MRMRLLVAAVLVVALVGTGLVAAMTERSEDPLTTLTATAGPPDVAERSGFVVLGMGLAVVLAVSFRRRTHAAPTV